MAAADRPANRRIGILGGTFDPPHLGHLLIAETARAALQLESVLFLPAGEPWLKSGRHITPAHQRRDMVALAIADHADFCISDCECKSGCAGRDQPTRWTRCGSCAPSTRTT